MGKEPNHEAKVAEIVHEIKAKGFYVRPVEEEENANAVIRTSKSPRISGWKDGERCYCTYQVYVTDHFSGNFTAADGTENGEPWCRKYHDVVVNHPEINKVLHFSAKFKDAFFWIEKDE